MMAVGNIVIRVANVLCEQLDYRQTSIYFNMNLPLGDILFFFNFLKLLFNYSFICCLIGGKLLYNICWFPLCNNASQSQLYKYICIYIFF